jgi:hypothetical protein
VRSLAEQALSFAHGLAHQIKFAVLQIAQASVDDSRRAAGDPGGEVVLLDQKSAFPGAGAFAGHGDAINSTANHHDVEVLALQGSSGFYR